MQNFKKCIDVATKRKKADLLLKNCRLVNVLTSEIYFADIAISNDKIVDVIEIDKDSYYEVRAKEVIDVNGMYAIPGLIEGHIHIESSLVTPEEFSRLVIPHGTTTVIADPHEIVNVCGMKGMQYMLDAKEHTKLDIKYMIPSCVPATPFENSGAVIGSDEVKKMIDNDSIIGLGEFMNTVGVINNDDECINKIFSVHKKNKVVDGHAPDLTGSDLSAYIGAGIKTDHECQTVSQMNERLRKGMYVILRQGSACSDLRELVKGVNYKNYNQCLLCSDDRQPATILEEGDLDHHLRICVEENIDPIMAIQMATINAANCYGLNDRGAIAPGKRADICIVEDLKDFKMNRVFIKGELVAKNGQYLGKVTRANIDGVSSSVNVKNFSKNKLSISPTKQVINEIINNDYKLAVNAIGVEPGSIVTKKKVVNISVDKDYNFVFDKNVDVAKIVVIERHNGLGNVGVGFIEGFGIKKGAIAQTVAHDSHNIVAIGTSDEEIEFAVNELIKQQGGVVVVRNNKVIDSIELKIAGLMSIEDGKTVMTKLDKVCKTIKEEIGLNDGIDGIMTLAFMALPVIPEIKLTDKGLFDVTKMEFMSIYPNINDDENKELDSLHNNYINENYYDKYKENVQNVW